jgi:hypothetical protein
MSVDERRARLVRRHRLVAQSRATTPLEVVESLVALHKTHPATVLLSTLARNHDFRPERHQDAH